jgi:hypothetical protein
MVLLGANMRLILLALPAFALVTGCEKAVTVVSPDTFTDRPITQIRVQFSPNFKPGTFHATLDGDDITGLFSPPPAPGGQSSANIGGGECGIAFGQAAGQGLPSPPPNMPVHTDDREPDASPSSGAVPAQPPQGVPPSGGTSPLPPAPAGLTVYWHRIVVDGGCNGGRICEGDEQQFLPLHLVGVPMNLPLTFGSPQSLQVETWPRASVAIEVRLMPELPNVKLNGGAPGATFLTTVPPGTRSAPVRVEAAVRSSQHKIWLCSTGVQRGLVTGLIN